MVKLEQLKVGDQVRVVPHQLVTLIHIELHKDNALSVAYRKADGQLDSQVLLRENEVSLEVVDA